MRQIGGRMPINRTILELKQILDKAKQEAVSTINRTILELKLEKCTCFDVVILSINRTILELKRTRRRWSRSSR